MNERIIQFALTKVPVDWPMRDIKARLEYWQQPDSPSIQRQTICALEVWVECLQQDKSAFTQVEARRINKILGVIPGYAASSSVLCGPYGRQRAFAKPTVSQEELTQRAILARLPR